MKVLAINWIPFLQIWNFIEVMDILIQWALIAWQTCRSSDVYLVVFKASNVTFQSRSRMIGHLLKTMDMNASIWTLAIPQDTILIFKIDLICDNIAIKSCVLILRVGFHLRSFRPCGCENNMQHVFCGANRQYGRIHLKTLKLISNHAAKPRKWLSQTSQSKNCANWYNTTHSQSLQTFFAFGFLSLLLLDFN